MKNSVDTAEHNHITILKAIANTNILLNELSDLIVELNFEEKEKIKEKDKITRNISIPNLKNMSLGAFLHEAPIIIENQNTELASMINELKEILF
jgi:hypothetical protein